MRKIGLMVVAAAALAACGRGGSGETTKTPPKEPVRACEKTDLPDCEKQCEAGSGESCITLGFAHITGNGVELDKARGAKLYVQSCEIGHGDGCHAAYSVFLYGVGVPADAVQSGVYLKKACTLGHEKSCLLLKRRQSLGI